MSFHHEKIMRELLVINFFIFSLNILEAFSLVVPCNDELGINFFQIIRSDYIDNFDEICGYTSISLWH